MKRISLLAVVALMLLASVDASACVVCRFHSGTWTCATVADGFDHCDWNFEDCVEALPLCPPQLAAQTPLATQWTIASVERLDGQRTLTANIPVKAARISPKPSNQR